MPQGISLALDLPLQELTINDSKLALLCPARASSLLLPLGKSCTKAGPHVSTFSDELVYHGWRSQKETIKKGRCAPTACTAGVPALLASSDMITWRII